MVELQRRLLTTLFYILIIAAGTLAAANCSRPYHCAISPNSGSEHRWGISLTQDSRDSDFYSGCHSNRGVQRPPSTTHRLGFFRRCQDFRKFLRVVEDDTKTEDAVPYWKIDDFLRFPGFSWVWVVFRAARAKKVEAK